MKKDVKKVVKEKYIGYAYFGDTLLDFHGSDSIEQIFIHDTDIDVTEMINHLIALKSFDEFENALIITFVRD